MTFTRVKSYLQTGEFTNCEHLYFGSDKQRALDRFRNEYPEHRDCIIVAEPYESDCDKNKEHFLICVKCGCVH